MKRYTPVQAKEKIRHYCAYQERCHAEVRNKLYEYGLSSDDVEELTSYLITEGFLNEERFAQSFAGGKFRIKKWGRIKIIKALESKGISKYCIKVGLKEISEEDYHRTLADLLERKSNLIVEENLYVKRDKLSAYLINKGYEPDLVWQTLKLNNLKL